MTANNTFKQLSTNSGNSYIKVGNLFGINDGINATLFDVIRAHLDKDCPLNEEVKSVEEAKYGEFKRPSPFSNGAKYHVGPPGYYTRIDNRLWLGEKRPSLEELMNKHLDELTRRRAEMEEWVKKLQENAEINTRNQSASLINLKTQIQQLTKEFHTKAANEINNSSFDHCKAVYTDKKTTHDNRQHERKRGKIQGYDPKGSRQWKEDPQKDVERLESNLKTRGRPKLRWEDRLKMDMKELRLSEDMTSDRNAWLVAFLADKSLFFHLVASPGRGRIYLHFTSPIARSGGIGYVVVVVVKSSFEEESNAQGSLLS
nr:hypothetical protein [Tanacetum cinerariifolium]